MNKEEVRDIFIKIFKKHIGTGRAISSEELFLKVTGKHANEYEFYERQYKWNSIKRILKELRKEGSLFVVMGTNYHYVLETKEEADRFGKKVDATIKGLLKVKKGAEEWINSKELKDMKRRELVLKK